MMLRLKNEHFNVAAVKGERVEVPCGRKKSRSIQSPRLLQVIGLAPKGKRYGVEL